MAPRRKKTKKTQFWNSLGRTAIKGSAGAGLGMTVGVIEETVSESAAQYTKAGIALIGLAGEMFIDPNKSPLLAEGAKASLYSGTALGGYELGKRAGRSAKEAKYKRDLDRMRTELQNDLHIEDESEETDKAAVVVPKARRTKKPVINGKVAET